MTLVQDVSQCQVARAETREHVGSGRMNKNRLRRLTFNNKWCIRL
jgi:hypothetical protein